MRVTFLKPSFAEKSDKVKVTFEVEAADVSQIMTLKQGESYEIAPCRQEVAEDKQTPADKLETARRLILEALGDMGNVTKEPELPLEVKKCCGTCAEWAESRDEMQVGICEDTGVDTPDDHECPNWKEG